jgi:hypothetical protein
VIDRCGIATGVVALEGKACVEVPVLSRRSCSAPAAAGGSASSSWVFGPGRRLCLMLIESTSSRVPWRSCRRSRLANGIKSVQTRCGRCHFGGPNRVGHLASGQPAALVKQFDRKLVKLRSASARGRRGHLALVRTMTEKGGV